MINQRMTSKQILEFVHDYVIKSGIDSIPGLAYALLNKEAELRTASFTHTDPDQAIVVEMRETATLIDEVRGIFEEEKAAELDKINPTYRLTDDDND